MGAGMTPEALDALTPEERRQVYGMLRLRVEVAADGAMVARGIPSEDWRPAGSDGFCENGLASTAAKRGPATVKRRQARYKLALDRVRPDLQGLRFALVPWGKVSACPDLRRMGERGVGAPPAPSLRLSKHRPSVKKSSIWSRKKSPNLGMCSDALP
jgi:hypothetical protein